MLVKNTRQLSLLTRTFNLSLTRVLFGFRQNKAKHNDQIRLRNHNFKNQKRLLGDALTLIRLSSLIVIFGPFGLKEISFPLTRLLFGFP